MLISFGVPLWLCSNNFVQKIVFPRFSVAGPRRLGPIGEKSDKD